MPHSKTPDGQAASHKFNKQQAEAKGLGAENVPGHIAGSAPGEAPVASDPASVEKSPHPWMFSDSIMCPIMLGIAGPVYWPRWNYEAIKSTSILAESTDSMIYTNIGDGNTYFKSHTGRATDISSKPELSDKLRLYASATATAKMNVSGTLNAFRVLYNPSLILPHCTIRTFDQLPIPLDNAFVRSSLTSSTSGSSSPLSSSHQPNSKPDIRAVVLDKDNCFAIPHTDTIHPQYEATFARLKAQYPRTLLIVSNSSGTATQDPSGTKAAALETATGGVPVLRHATKKPGCGDEIMRYFRGIEGAHVERPDQVAIVGDRLFTDVMMANMMGAWGVWVRDGPVVPKGWTGFWTRLEGRVADVLMSRNWTAKRPGAMGTENGEKV